MDRIRRSTPFRLLCDLLQVNPLKLHRLIFGVHSLKARDVHLIDLMIGGASFVRWGDGETAISRGKSISYQESNDELRIKLLEVLNSESKILILGLPWAFHSSILSKEWNLRKLKILLSTRILLNKQLKKNLPNELATAEFWYSNAGNIQGILKQICHGKSTILIASRNEYLELCPPGTLFIESPRIDAYSSYARITNILSCEIEKNKEQSKETIVLCAIGPASKAVAVDYFRLVQVIDVGHGFDFAMNGYGQFAWRIENA